MDSRGGKTDSLGDMALATAKASTLGMTGLQHRPSASTSSMTPNNGTRQK